MSDETGCAHDHSDQDDRRAAHNENAAAANSGKTNESATEAAVAERREQVRQAQAQLEQARLNLSYCEVRAPSDGWITRRNVQLGSFL
jgi:multidrug resistance efflux pump